MSITGINNQSGTYVNAMSYHQIVPERAKLRNAHLVSDEFLYNNSKSQEEALKVLNVINEDKHCAKNVDKIKMAQMILKVAKEFCIDPVVLACIIRQETHFTPQYGKNGQGYMQLVKISIEDMFQRPKIYDKKLEEIKKRYPTPELLYEAIKKDPELNIRIGVILFKAKYNAADGNLALALKNYNGSSIKEKYSKDVMGMIRQYA